jgi:alpha-mannosidase
MPQILKWGGCDFFYFCRGGDDIPLFWWEALDGTRVLAFEEAATGSWYNAGISTAQILELGDFLRVYDSSDALWVYGVGNHGGGPTREHIETALKMKGKPHTPDPCFSTAHTFFNRLQNHVDLEKIPVLRKELNSRSRAGFYGTYTSHGDIKRWNRDAEALAESAEVLAVTASFHGFPYPRGSFRKVWEDITWNHHHDTLPGTSIHPSYEKSRILYEGAMSECRAIGREALERLAGLVPPIGGAIMGAIPSPAAAQKLLVFNPLCWERDSLVIFDLLKKREPNLRLEAVNPRGEATPVQITEGKGLFWARDLPSMGYRTYVILNTDAAVDHPLKATPTLIENGLLRVEIDPSSGKIVRLFHKGLNKEFLKTDGSSGLEIYFEKPHPMSAWVIGEFAPFKETPKIQKIDVLEEGPVRATLRIKSVFGASSLTQYLSLTREGDLLDIRLEVQWKVRGNRERPAPFLKAFVETAFHPEAACFDIPFGALERPADGEEVPALKWAELNKDGFGLGLFNDCRHGYGAKEGVLRLSLIRSPYWPDPESDVGLHNIGYALFPHGGDWREANTPRRATEFNRPVWVLDVPLNSQGTLPEERSYFSLDTTALIPTGLKRAEDGEGIIFRCFESFGREAPFTLTCFCPIKRAAKVNFMEDPLEPASILSGRLQDRLPPWRIATYLLHTDKEQRNPD